MADTRKDSLDYSKELKLNVQCDEDNQHIAVLYCQKCETSLCKVCSDRIHSQKSLSDHQIVRLTKKPEPPTNSSTHPLKKAKLGHDYEELDEECDKIRKNVAGCLKKIEVKRAICDKNLEEYDSYIPTFSTTDNDFMKTQRDEIYKFYTEARSSALKAFDDFAVNRIETLKLEKNQCISDKTKLGNMSSEVQKIQKMRKRKMIENKGAVERLMKQAEEEIDEPTELIPSDSYTVVYPSAESMSIKLDPPELIKLMKQPKTLAVHFGYFECYFTEYYFIGVEELRNGSLHHYDDDLYLLELYDYPKNDTIDLLRYKYVCMMLFGSWSEKFREKELKEAMAIEWWIRIIVVVDRKHFKDNMDEVNRVRKIAETDKRVEVVKHKSTFDLLALLMKS